MNTLLFKGTVSFGPRKTSEHTLRGKRKAVVLKFWKKKTITERLKLKKTLKDRREPFRDGRSLKYYPLPEVTFFINSYAN